MADPSYKLFRSIMMGEVEEEDSPKRQLSDALFSDPGEDECRGEEEELEYEEDEDEDAEEDENSEEDVDAEEKKPIRGGCDSTAAKNMTTSENRIKRQCVVCGKRILYLAHHLARHHKVRDKGRRLCFLYQSRQNNPITRSRMPAYNRKPRDCIFPGCFAKALKRLDNHLVAVHKLKRGSAVFTQTLIRSRAGQQQPTDEENCTKKEIDGIGNHWEDQDDVPLNTIVHHSTQATSSPSSPGAPDVTTADAAPAVASPSSASPCSMPPTLPLTVPIIPTLSSPSHLLLTSSAITAHVAPIIPAQPSTPVQSSTLRQPFTPAQSSTVAVKLSPQRLCSTPPMTNLSSILHSSLTSPAITANDIPTIPAQPSTNAQSSTLPQLFTPSKSSTDAVMPTPQRLSSPLPSPLAAPVNSSLQDLPPAAALYIQYLEERIAVLERVIQLNTLKKEDGSVLPAGGR